MIAYLILLFLTVVSLGFVHLLAKNKHLSRKFTWIVLLGTSTAFLAMLVSQTMSFWYALLVILGMSIATAVLLAKRQEARQ